MNITYFLLFFLLFLSFVYSINIQKIISSLKNESSNFDEIENEFANGSMKGFLTLNDGLSLFLKFQTEFPNLVLLSESIGKTYEGNEIQLFGLSNKSIEIENKTSMLFTGVHHAREPLSFTMNVYIMTKILFDVLHGDKEKINILEESVLYFIPIINIDGYLKIEKIFNDTKILSDSIRKNRKPSKNGECSEYQIGVDLNRNYDYEFGFDNDGSSASECAEDYRGDSAFSEPETQAVRDFILKNKANLKIVVNFHAYGNLWIVPFNFNHDPKNKKLKSFKKLSKLYNDFHLSANFSKTAKYGNAEQTINYVANGEASDWILGKLGIFSISPELGDDNKGASNNFYPDRNEIVSILQTSYQPINFLINLMVFQPEVKEWKITKNKLFSNLIQKNSQNIIHNEYKTLEITIFNHGMSKKNIEHFSTTGFNVSQIFYKFFEENNEQSSNITQIEFDNHNNTYFFKNSYKISIDSREFLKLYFVYQEENSKNISIQIDKILFETSLNSMDENDSKNEISIKKVAIIVSFIFIVILLFIIIYYWRKRRNFLNHNKLLNLNKNETSLNENSI